MRTSRTNTRRRNDSQGAATNPAAAAASVMSDAVGSQLQAPSADAAHAAAAPAASTSGRPRRSAATQAQLKLMQQRFEAEHAPVSRQPSDPNADAAAAAAAHPPRRRGRPPTRAAATVKRATTGKRVRVSRSSSSESESDVEEEDDGGGPVRGGSSRSAAAKAPVRKKVKYASSTDSDDSEGEEESDELAARVTRRKNRAAVAADDESDSGGSDEDAHSSDSESEQSGEEQEEEEAQEEEEEESPEQDEEEAVSSEEEAPLSSSEEDEEEDEDAWLPGSESRSAPAATPKRAARGKAAKAKAKSKFKAAEESSAGASGAVPSIMDLLDQQDDKAAIDMMRLALQSDNNDGLAALLCSRSNADGQTTTELSECSTFLQRFYRVHCAFNTPGFADHRPRLMRLIELHGSFHATSRNHVGQTLLHTICMPSTYSVTHRVKNRRHSGHNYYSSPDEWPEYHEWTDTENYAKSFTSALLEMMIRAEADFQQPDDNGVVPLLELAKCVRSGYANLSIIEHALFPPSQVQPKYKGLVRMPPCDLSLVDDAGSTVLTLLFNKKKYGCEADMWSVATMLCEKHSRELGHADLFARNNKGQCALSLLAEEARKIETPASQLQWEKREDDKKKQLPQQLLQAWQAARTPAVRKELDVWMIPVLADICCEYVMGPAQKVGHKMSAQEQESVFGLEPRAPPWWLIERPSSTLLRRPAMSAPSLKEALAAARAAVGGVDEQGDAEGEKVSDAAAVEEAELAVAAELDGQDVEAAASTSASPPLLLMPAMDDDDGPTDMEF